MAKKRLEITNENFNRAIIGVCEKYHFCLRTPVDGEDENGYTSFEKWKKYNRFCIDCNEAFLNFTKPFVLIEFTHLTRAYPTSQLPASSYIYKFLKEKGFDAIIKQYGLSSFLINVQTKERTFIDKVFILCDCYMGDHIEEHSRHLYDLYKLYPCIDFDESFNELVKAVYQERKKNGKCFSAINNCVQLKLREIYDRDIYKQDYERITTGLLFEDIPYEKTKNVIDDIINLNIFE
ncbi:MAG TPA: nucleotidyl transferase AbiEii/AbiGii toxin family protein [Bacilli bacterium]|nr:nucleotidyl transferase AbiEii/AbiGii toxin family protein [Bacilli bacterium]